jgi:hypothetical protein
MAEKTIVLRPISSQFRLAGGEPNYIPSGTTRQNAYTLVNESEADDDATYIIFTTVLATVYFGFAPTVNNITGIKVHVRAQAPGTAGAFGVIWCLIDKENKIIARRASVDRDIPTAGNEWHDYIYNLGDDAELLSKINSIEYSTLDIGLYGGENVDSSNGIYVTHVDTNVTQIYLELTYKENDPIYLRENGVWTAVEGMVYQKTNNAWVEANADILQTEDKYRLITI